MRTGNAFFSLDFRESGRHACRLTLLDAGTEAVAELVIPDDPWEESASVPVESMSRMRTAIEDLPEKWPDPERHGDALTIEASSEIAGARFTWSAHLAAPADLPPAPRRFLAALSAAASEALVGARSRRALEAISRWCEG